MTPRRQYGAVLVGVTAGAGLVLFAASRVWRTEVQARPAPLSPVEIAHTGGSLYPSVPALALVALAGAGGLVATRGTTRKIVGALVGVMGIGIVALSASALGSDDVATGWIIAGGLGALSLVAAGGWTLRYGDRWPSMGSRYSRTPTADASDPGASGSTDTPETSGTALWDALDRGGDPTGGDPTGGDPRGKPIEGDHTEGDPAKYD